MTAAEAAEADARMQHFLKCLRFQRIYEAALRFRERQWRAANPTLGVSMDIPLYAFELGDRC